MGNISENQLIEVLHCVLDRLRVVEDKLKEIPVLKRQQAFIIKQAVDNDRALREGELRLAKRAKRTKKN